MKKADLVKHLEQHPEVRRPIVQSHWTVEALRELHSGLHKERKA